MDIGFMSHSVQKQHNSAGTSKHYLLVADTEQLYLNFMMACDVNKIFSWITEQYLLQYFLLPCIYDFVPFSYTTEV